MIRGAGRRAALVAAVVGLLAALTSGTGPATAQAVLSTAATAATAATSALQPDPTALSAPATGVVTDGVRAAHPAAVRASGGERSPAHTGAVAVAALLLLLAAGCALLGVRRRAAHVLRTSWRAPAAPRAPPSLAAC